MNGKSQTIYRAVCSNVSLDPPQWIVIKNLVPWSKAQRSNNLSSFLMACLIHCRLTVVHSTKLSKLNLSSSPSLSYLTVWLSHCEDLKISVLNADGVNAQGEV